MNNGPFMDDKHDVLPVEDGDIPVRYFRLLEGHHQSIKSP
jgi:hypothetical protein